MSLVVRGSKKSLRWTAWAGDLSEIRRIGRIVEEMFEVRKQAIEALKTDHEDEDSDASQRPSVSYRLPDDIVVDREAPYAIMVIVDDEHVSGDIETLFPEIDRRSVQLLSFVAAASREDQLFVKFSRRPSDYSVLVQAASQDTGWVRQSMSRLADDIEKGVPWWEFMHRPCWARRIVNSCVFLIAAVSVFLMMPTYEYSSGTYFLTAFRAPIAMAGGVGGFLFFEWLSKWMFPRLELLGEGVQPSGTRRIVGLSLVLVSIPIGVLVNWIS